MTYTHTLNGNPDAVRLRKLAGKYIRERRESAGLTQQEVAKAVGLDYYTMVSQIELGKNRVPPDKLSRFAQALDCDPREFGKRLLQYYDPFMWQMLFGGPSRGTSEAARRDHQEW